jgi:hypothetical protein
MLVDTQKALHLDLSTRAIYAVFAQLPVERRSSHYFAKELKVQIDQPSHVIEVWLAYTPEPLVQQGLAKTTQTVATGH